MKKLFTLSLLISSTSIFAAPSSEDLKQDIRNYSILHGVSTEEANKSIFLEANRDAALNTIEQEFKGRIAGIYVESSPSYKIVVRVTGQGTNQKRTLAVGDTISKLNLPIEVVYGASKQEKRQKDILKQPKNLLEKLSLIIKQLVMMKKVEILSLIFEVKKLQII